MSDSQVPQPQHDHERVEVPTDLPTPSAALVTLVVVGVVVLLVALFVIGWIPHVRQVKEAEARAKTMQSAAPVVNVAPPKLSPTLKDIVLPCDVKANQTTAIYARTTGYLKKMYVDIQSEVKEGQLLAELEAPEVDAQLAQAKASLEQNKSAVLRSEANLRLAKATLERYLQAQKTSPGSVTQEDLDTKQSAYDDAHSALEQSNSNVKAAEANVEQLTVTQGFQKLYAPFAGTITARNYDVGALISANAAGSGKELFDLAQIDTLRVFVNVPQTYVTNVKTGQNAFLTVRNYGGTEFTGTVARTAGALDNTTRTLSVEIDFPNKDGKLFAGMYGTLRLPIQSNTPVLTIPSSALVFNPDGLQVAIVKDDRVHIQQVKVARDLGTEIEVVEGVTQNDQVVTNPGERIGEGVTVKPITSDGKPAETKTKVAAGQ